MKSMNFDTHRAVYQMMCSYKIFRFFQCGNCDKILFPASYVSFLRNIYPEPRLISRKFCILPLTFLNENIYSGKFYIHLAIKIKLQSNSRANLCKGKAHPFTQKTSNMQNSPSLYWYHACLSLDSELKMHVKSL